MYYIKNYDLKKENLKFTQFHLCLNREILEKYPK